MSSAWLLPEHIADVLPAQARHIEELRRGLLDVARSFGCELVMPPLMEHIESLLSGTGRDLDLKTFKLVDQLSGRTLGVRADATPQVARIDAHLLNRAGVTRLCYCGPVLHTRPSGMQGTREPLQFGAEIYGHAGLEADLEVQDLALDCLRGAGLDGLTLDLADARIVRALLAGVAPQRRGDIQAALAGKDVAGLNELCTGLDEASRRALLALPALYGDESVIARAGELLPPHEPVRAALADLATLARHARQAHPEVQVGFDLADVGGASYYSGARFAIYAKGCSDSIARGGRYDEVGAIFGRNRPAVGFSLDLKELAECVAGRVGRPAVRAPWSEDAALRAAVRRLREQGETVVCILPGHEHEGQEFECDRELVAVGGQWAVRAL
ncbi:MAG: ATP phosphoribosyltransferase regulatory subunit [Piscinibacter sp.]|uniref:ATP phosphoribosyltransferase regulatory subunit n=1 Tax=Piscinibacter sp. TaxID=1903157 RepID=UPI001B59203D|nr:ATP phosphoribosyltransferase regulatory subunit [Piscinibacter sp.]MBP5990409.1 ATP phosphoribosyltransferase regulatory subunit [Piscinibacter sp.]MBP6028874.1 ATP phosphoribosyltransferase regulatory subunit [Piscinibacter sp.]